MQPLWTQGSLLMVADVSFAAFVPRCLPENAGLGNERQESIPAKVVATIVDLRHTCGRGSCVRARAERKYPCSTSSCSLSDPSEQD